MAKKESWFCNTSDDTSEKLKITVTELINLIYTDMDGHENDCDCRICLTMDTISEYILRSRLDKRDAGMVG